MEKVKWYQRNEGMTDHLVYTDKKANELDKLLKGEKTKIIRGAAGRKCPYGRVNIGDVLYFVENDGTKIIKAKCLVKSVYNSPKMEEDESNKLIDQNIKQLNLSVEQLKRWRGKKYLCLIEVENIQLIEPVKYQRENNMDDWIIVDNINEII